MKKFLSLSFFAFFFALMLSAPVFAMESKDVDMSEQQDPATAAAAAAPSTFGMRELRTTVEESAFDMSGLQEAIDDIAYTHNQISHLSYYDRSQDTDFVREMFKRYSALQQDLIQLQQTMPPEAFKQAFDDVNKAVTSIISSEDLLKISYLVVTHKFNSEQDITPEMLTLLIIFFKKEIHDATPSLDISPNDKSFLYKLIKVKQEKREAFYSLLLKPHLNREYQAILRGEISDFSEEFLQGIITISINCALKAVRVLIKQQLQAPVVMMPGFESEIFSLMKAKRAVIFLLLKHFGEISGIDIM